MLFLVINNTSSKGHLDRVSYPYCLDDNIKVKVMYTILPGKILKSKMADPTWPPFNNHDLIPTVYDIISPRCGPQRRHLWTYYLFCKSYCQLFTCEGEGGTKYILQKLKELYPPPGVNLISLLSSKIIILIKWTICFCFKSYVR